MKTIILTFLVLLLPNIMNAQSEDKFVPLKTISFRSGPGINYSVIGKLNLDDQLILIEKEQNGWWYVTSDLGDGYVLGKLLKKDPNKDWNKKKYSSGETPECENVDPEYDYGIDNLLRIQVGTHTDVVLKLMKKSNGGDICNRIVFIRSGDTYEMKNIPEGNYYLKIAYGSDWRQKVVDNLCYGKFMKNAHYEIGQQKLDFNLLKTGNGIQIPSFELFLDVRTIRTKSTRNFNANAISEAIFNK